ncbi:MAG TPA: hypothetical protein V6C52_12335 [Coleofasciculaceae cyanobacterium]
MNAKPATKGAGLRDETIGAGIHLGSLATAKRGRASAEPLAERATSGPSGIERIQKPDR